MKFPRLKRPGRPPSDPAAAVDTPAEPPGSARPGRRLSDAVDVAGLGCLVGAAWWWQPIVGLVVLGLVLLLIGWVIDR